MLRSPNFAGCLVGYEWFETVAQGFTALVETGFDYGLEEFLVATEFCAGIASQADYGRFDLRRRIECPLANREKVFDVVPGLEKHRKDTVGFAARLLGYALRHLLLNHTNHLWDAVLVVDDAEENL